MAKLTVQLDVILKKDLKEYLFSINGVLDAIVDFEEEKIDITYDDKITSNYILKKELNLFFDRDFPIIISFAKHFENGKEYNFVIDDACCDHCFYGFVDELYNTKGIEKAVSNYDSCSKFRNLEFSIEYDESKINIDEIKRIIDNY